MQPIHAVPLGDLLEQVGAKIPAPGGGAVASTVGALGAALGRMVVSYSVGKKNLAEFAPSLERADVLLRRTADLLLELAMEDAAAYGLVNELQRLPDDHPRRVAEYPGAVEAAVAAPRAVLGAACDLLRLLESLAPITNRHLRSDLAVAAILAEAAARASWWNVSINLPTLPDEARRITLANESRSLVADAIDRARRVEAACA